MASLKLKAKLMDVFANTPVVIMNYLDGKELGLCAGDRVLVQFNSHSIIASLDTTKKIVKKGEIGVYRDAQILGVKNNGIISISPTSKPKSLEYIIDLLHNYNGVSHYILKIVHQPTNSFKSKPSFSIVLKLTSP